MGGTRGGTRGLVGETSGALGGWWGRLVGH